MRWIVAGLLWITALPAMAEERTTCRWFLGEWVCTTKELRDTRYDGWAGALLKHVEERKAERAAQPQIVYVPVPAAPAAQPISNRTKFCPVGGELWGEDINYCPNHGVELRVLEQQ